MIKHFLNCNNMLGKEHALVQVMEYQSITDNESWFQLCLGKLINKLILISRNSKSVGGTDN